MVAFEDLLMDQRHFIARRRDPNLPSFLQHRALERQRFGSKLFEVCGIEIENVSGSADKLSVARGNDLGKGRTRGKIHRLDFLAILGIQHADRECEISRATAGIARSQPGRAARPVHLIDKHTFGRNKENGLMQRPAKIEGAEKSLNFLSPLYFAPPLWFGVFRLAIYAPAH